MSKHPMPRFSPLCSRVILRTEHTRQRDRFDCVPLNRGFKLFYAAAGRKANVRIERIEVYFFYKLKMLSDKIVYIMVKILPSWFFEF